MITIGLTGNMGSGKSTAAAYLAQLGAAVINADVIGHQIIAKGGRAYRPLFRHCTAVGTPFPLHRSGCRGGAALSHWIGEKDPDRQPTGRAVQRVPGVR